MSNGNWRELLAGTRPDFFPNPDDPADPARRVRDLESILAHPRQARRPVRRRLLSISVTAAALAAAVVAGGTLVGNEPERPAPDTDTSTARQVLLAAANAAAGTEASGRYWHVRTQYGGPAAGSGGNGPFMMITDAGSESWYSPTGQDPSVTIGNIEFSTRPFTPADRPAWEKAGYAETAASPLATRWNGVPTLYFAGDLISVSDLLALPTDPAALKAWLVDRFHANPPEAHTDQTDWLVQEVVQLLADLPASPGTRAAAYQVLADLPGFRVLTAAELPGGSGVGVARPTSFGPVGDAVRSGPMEHQVVIDPDTGLLLAQQYVLADPGDEDNPLPVGTVVYRVTVVAAGWVDSDPVVPPNAIVSDRN